MVFEVEARFRVLQQFNVEAEARRILPCSQSVIITGVSVPIRRRDYFGRDAIYGILQKKMRDIAKC